MLILQPALVLGAEVAQAQGSSGVTLNVKSAGAVGDGKADDTNALQKALDHVNTHGGEIVLPPGVYRVTKTLKLNGVSSGIFRGQGGSPFDHRPGATTIRWGGACGGTLIEATTSCWSFRDLNLDGGGEAGVLFHFKSAPGRGNLLKKFENVHLSDADVGFQAATGESDPGNADYYFAFTSFCRLKTAFLVRNDQGVDYLFNHVFALDCGKVFHFERGGNLHVNNAQLTNCGLFLEIGGGGRNAGTFLCNMVRIEADGGGRTRRCQLLKTFPAHRQASIKFVGFDDCQWDWTHNKTSSRATPLCEIGPGSGVVIESSIFNSPLAALTGDAEASASLILRECSFGYLDPQDAITANESGFFKLLNNLDDKMRPLPDVLKWPASSAKVIDAKAGHSGSALKK